MKRKNEYILEEGHPFIGISGAAAFLATVSGTHLVLSGGLWLLTLFFLCFFRNPEREPAEEGREIILSPADGRIVQIEEKEGPLTGKPMRRVSIRLTPCDIHVQRSPVEGEIVAQYYLHGTFLAVTSKKASLLNEQNRLLFRTPENREVEVVQIAGFLTRRIKMFRELGKIERGERYGMILFGSQVDLYLPLEVELKVGIGQKVRGGETPIGSF
ncbi:MAG: phosphatidylserine decarboxylase [Campylobacterales bacterium]